jgi:molybdate transport repressor ModE-like protein
MELDAGRLRILVEVAHAGSIAEAARKLSFTPSALSQQLAKLEKELGTRLLDRTAAGVVPTTVGAVLVEHGERVLGELREARAAVKAAMDEQPQRLALGTFATAGEVLVPGALAALERQYPQAELSLVDVEPPGGYGLVTSGDLDLLITHRYPGVPSVPCPGLDRWQLLVDPLRVALPAGHRLTTQEVVALADLADDRWISGAPGMPNRTCLSTLAARANLDLRVAYETADYHLILELVGAGLGIALVPRSLLAGVNRSRVSIHALSDASPAREICLVHRRRPPALVRDLITLLRTSSERLKQSEKPAG